MSGRPAQDVDEGLLSILSPVEGAQESRTLDFGTDDVGLAWLARQHRLKLL